MKEQKKWFSNRWIIIGGAVAAVTIAAIIATVLIVRNNNSDRKDTSNTSATTSTDTTGQSETTLKNCVSDDCLAVNNLTYPAGQLPADVSAAVKAALDDEYKAYSMYDAVVTEFGALRPFSMIIRAEETHIASLKAILDKYGEQIPANPYLGKLSIKTTDKENCQLGIDAEIANIALYRDQLLPKVTAYPDITTVFTNLMDASKDKHLPAFERCN
jgi:hypothetical protein